MNWCEEYFQTWWPLLTQSFSALIFVCRHRASTNFLFMGLTMILVDYPLLGTPKCKQKWVPPPFESLISSVGGQHCLPNRIYTLYRAAQSPTQTFILNHGKHPRSYEKYPRDTFLMTPSEYLTLFSRFQASDIKEHPVKRSPWSCSIHLELRKSSCWHSKPRCWYTPIFILRSKYDTPPTPWLHEVEIR